MDKAESVTSDKEGGNRDGTPDRSPSPSNGEGDEQDGMEVD